MSPKCINYKRITVTTPLRREISKLPTYHVGCSGWSYPDWKGPFYPKHLPASEELAAYAGVFDTVEVDSSYYNIPRRDVVASWHDKTPPEFQFVCKMFNGVTHDLVAALREDTLGTMLDRYYSALKPLGSKLAAVLLQFPPSFSIKNDKELHVLLSRIPGEIRHAIELRHGSWFHHEGAIEHLVRENVTIAGSLQPHVAPFVEKTGEYYIFRFIGDREIDTFGKIQRDANEEMETVKALLESVDLAGDIYVFFNNHYAGFAPESANAFKTMLGLKMKPFKPAGRGQTSLSDFG